MKFQQREALRRAFEAPPPENKRAFLRKLPRRRPTLWRMVCRQLRYIRPWTWAVSAVVFAATLLIGRSGEPMALWWCSALTPFLAMALVTELARSAACGMEELEMATRFSLRTVILSRLLLLGFSDVTVLALFLVFLPAPGGILQVGLSLTVPYLMSSLLGLRLVRRLRGTEGFLAALAAAGFVGCGALAAAGRVVLPLSWGLVGAAVLMVWTGREYRRLLVETEEYGWN